LEVKKPKKISRNFQKVGILSTRNVHASSDNLQWNQKTWLFQFNKKVLDFLQKFKSPLMWKDKSNILQNYSVTSNQFWLAPVKQQWKNLGVLQLQWFFFVELKDENLKNLQIFKNYFEGKTFWQLIFGHLEPNRLLIISI
jgi:hypothetical protein